MINEVDKEERKSNTGKKRPTLVQDTDDTISWQDRPATERFSISFNTFCDFVFSRENQ